jgi:serine/threonine-protein kinase
VIKTPASSTELRLGDAVLTAAGLDGAEREAYLRELATLDATLAAEAGRRVAAAASLYASFLATPAAARLAGGADAREPPAVGAALSAGERYELGKCLGEGGMGRVVLAFDRQLGRSVALKFLTHEDPAVLRLFLGEARAQARVQHEHVLEIYDSGELDGEPFISMRYVAAGTLADIGATLSLEHKVKLLAQAAEGLHAAHREGLLHRDVKPSNVLVERTPDGELNALVTDFGLATELGDADSLAATAIAGTPHYIAPERLSGVPAALDRRSDVYSLGITIYRLLTGELPLQGTDTVDVLRQALHGELPPPHQRLPTLPVELDAIVMRCTARDPDQRYASARAVAADLQRYLDGEVVEAYAASLAYRLTRFVLRNKLLSGMAAAAAASLLVGAVGVTIFALRADAARQRAEMRQGQAEQLIRFTVVDLYEKLESLGRLDVLDAVGDAATKYFAAVPPDELSEAELLRRSQMLHQIGDVRIKQGNLAGAAAPMEQSLARRRRTALRPRPERVLGGLRPLAAGRSRRGAKALRSVPRPLAAPGEAGPRQARVAARALLRAQQPRLAAPGRGPSRRGAGAVPRHPDHRQRPDCRRAGEP